MAAKLDGLLNLRVLVIEDEPLLAMTLMYDLEDAGAVPLGPARSIREAWNLLRTEACNAAILDIDLQGEPAYQIADHLIECNVPFIFTTGYDAGSVHERFSQVPVCPKPSPALEALTLLAACVSGYITRDKE